MRFLRNRWRRVLAVGAIAAAVLLGSAGGVAYWYYHRPAPTAVDRELGPGVSYERRLLPGPVIVHLIWLELNAPELSFLVTPSDPNDGYPLRGLRTSEFVRQHDLLAAINGDFFEPWRSDGPWDYYPHAGDGVRTLGLAASKGDRYEAGDGADCTLFISADNQASIGEPVGAVFHAISGRHWLVRGGEAGLTAAQRARTGRHPRTAVGLDADGKRMGWLVVDGRQPNYSLGMTLAELEELALAEGFADAINLDGGGSTTMVGRDARGRIRLLNSPINHRIPGWERYVANHLGVRIGQP